MKLIPNWFKKLFQVCGPNYSHDWTEVGERWLNYEQTPNWRKLNNLTRTCERCGEKQEARYTPSMSGRAMMAWEVVT